MYKEGQVVVTGIKRLKEDGFTAISIVDEVDDNSIRLGKAWVNTNLGVNITSFQKFLKLGPANYDFVRTLSDPEVVKEAKSLVRILFEGKQV